MYFKRSFFSLIAVSMTNACISAWCGTPTPAPVKIAITQIVSHPSLDEIARGVRESLAQKGFGEKDGVTYLMSNASGDIKIASQIARKIASQSPTVAVAITTPSAQTVAKALKGSKTKVVFSAVTDPVAANLVPELNKSTAQITGTIDFPPILKQVQLIKIVSEFTKKVGVLYSLSEVNAIAQVIAFEKIAEQQGLRVQKVGVAKSSDIPQAAQKLSGEVDALMVLNDNMIVSSIESVILAARKATKPLFVSDPDSVKRGALAAVAHNQYQVGFQTGAMVARILEGEAVKNLAPEYPLHAELYVNEETAAMLNIPTGQFDYARKELLEKDQATHVLPVQNKKH